MLSDHVLADWSRAASEWRAGDHAYPVPDGLRQFDVAYASDVSSLMPLLYYVVRFMFGYRPARSPTCLEIGTADGSSLLPVLKACAEIGGHAHSVDPDPCPAAHFLVDKFEYRARWTHHQMASDHFFETFKDPIDFAFIDGDHRWPVVERDVRNSYALLRPGGMLWVSDYEPIPAGLEFENEYDGRPFTPHVGQDPVGDKQMEHGIGKAIRRSLPALEGAQLLHLPIWPNPSVLIRKPLEGEAL